MTTPDLSLATTAELIEELKARSIALVVARLALPANGESDGRDDLHCEVHGGHATALGIMEYVRHQLLTHSVARSK